MTTAPDVRAPLPPAPAAAVPARRRRSSDNLVLGLGGVATFAALLEVIPRTGLVDDRYLPPLSSMLSALADRVQTPEFWEALRQTLTTWGFGLGIALVVGVVLGVVIGSVEILRAATATTIEFLRPIPSVALIPLAVLLYGTSMQSTLLLVVYASFWQVLVQVLYGVRDVDPVARETARSYRFSRLSQIRTVTWPTTLPYAMTGLRLAAAVALILTITGELIIGTPGLGNLIAVAQTSGAVDSMYALVLVTGALGVLVNILARRLERRVLRWHPSVRRESAS
ncbi:ABC transporter permease [Phytoactinopolyspora halotolerans]|uniref:ABC transporter permease n=1 Tax=Phytoactinopolyspora halotolerans TaxID=1981512 RepID=A0A6L9S817_9ACTN|nr:ABC transporter permease [Phytoactinopolyspora halotolerans]NEE01269.1 ABC transporter permease [Phytoactinopolyspora halotolerans]